MARRLPGVQVHVFSDRDIAAKAEQIKAALDGADVFFGSLLFDFDQVCRYRPCFWFPLIALKTKSFILHCFGLPCLAVLWTTHCFGLPCLAVLWTTTEIMDVQKNTSSSGSACARTV